MASKRSSDNIDVENMAAEKSSVEHKEQPRGNMSPHDAEFLASYPQDKQKKAVRKVDVC